MKVMYMKKVLIILLIVFIILAVSIYTVYSYRVKMISQQKLNKEYEEYYNIQILGTELISIINRTIDINNKNQIGRDENNYYIDNGKDSIEIYIRFIYKSEIKEVKMEDIEKMTTETFIKMYSTASFKCTNIEYHEKINRVKSLTFEELQEST